MPKFERQLGHDEAWEEAQQLKKRLKENYPEKKAGNFSGDDYAVENEIMEVEKSETYSYGEDQEIELSPEVIERIMDKVQDVFKYGTAYSCILDFPFMTLGTPVFENAMRKYFSHSGPMAKILQKGILGVPIQHKQRESRKEYLENIDNEWKKSLRNKEQNFVSFNIMGRSIDPSSELEKQGLTKEQVERLYYKFAGPWFKGIAIIFDLKNYEELEPLYKNEGNPEYLKGWRLNSYRIRGPREYVDGVPNKYGDYTTTAEFGFSLSSRIAPDTFTGLVIDRKFFSLEIVELMINIHRNDPELLIPIYDPAGNLLWPQRMRYEKVKEFVTERDPE